MSLFHPHRIVDPKSYPTGSLHYPMAFEVLVDDLLPYRVDEDIFHRFDQIWIPLRFELMTVEQMGSAVVEARRPWVTLPVMKVKVEYEFLGWTWMFGRVSWTVRSSWIWTTLVVTMIC